MRLPLVDEAKAELQTLYKSDLDDDAKRVSKQELLDDLSAAAARLLEASRLATTNWLVPPLNNARLASLGLYEGHHGAFKKILRDCNGQLACFYAETKELAELELDERKQRLDQMAD